MTRPAQIKYRGRIYVKAEETVKGSADEVRTAVAALDPAITNLKAAAKNLEDPPTPAQLNGMHRNISRVLEVLGVFPFRGYPQLRVRLSAGEGVYGELQKLQGKIVQRP